MGRPLTKAQIKAVDKYKRENYDQTQFRVPKGEKEVIRAHAESMGESLNGFIARAVHETMIRDMNK